MNYQDTFTASFIILMVALVLRVILWWIIQDLKNQFISYVVRARAILGNLESELREIEEGAHGFGSNDPEPYESKVRDLNQNLTQAWKKYECYERQRRQLLREIPNYPRNLLIRFFWGYWPEPYLWVQYRNKIIALWNSIQRVEAQGVTARQLLEDLQNMPITVSRRCKSLRKVSDGVVAALNSLKRSGFHGSTIESFAEQLEKLCLGFEHIPACFFQDSEDLVLREASKASTISAWQILEQLETPLRDSQNLVQQWQARYREIDQTQQVIQQAGETAQRRLNDVPKLIDLGDLSATLSMFLRRSHELQEEFKHPTIETLTTFPGEAKSIISSLDQLAQRAIEIKQQYNELREILITNTLRLEQIRSDIREIATADKFPLKWDQTEVELKCLEERRTSIGTEHTQRSLAQLADHLKTAKQLQSEILALGETVERIRTSRAQLIKLLESLMTTGGTALPELAENLYKSVSKYASENWDKQDAVDTLLTDAQVLAEQQAALVPARLDETLEESSLGRRLDAVQLLSDAQKDFRARLERIDKTLTLIREQEEQAKEELTSTLQALERLNPLPSESTLLANFDAHWKAIENLKRQGRELGQQLEKKMVGIVSEKAKAIVTWKDSSQTLVRTIHQEIKCKAKKAKDKLNTKVNELKRIASFAQEPAMIEATTLLTMPSMPEIPNVPLPPVVETVSQINDLLKEYAALLGCVERVDQTIARPLKGYLAKLDRVRKVAQDKINNLKAQCQPTDWPPVTCDLEPITNRWLRAEQDLNELIKSGESLQFVIHRIDHVINLYEEIVGLVDDKASEVKQQRATLADIQARIDRWKRQLISYREQNLTDIAVIRAVDERLDKIETEYRLAQLRHENKQLTFNQARTILEELWRIVYQDLHVSRPKTIQIIKVGTIISEASVSISQSVIDHPSISG